MSPDVANFLLELLKSQSLQIGNPNFDETVKLITRARNELMQYLDVEE